MSSRAESEHAPKREAILAAALELFAERGFHGTAVPLVAERAGVGAGTVYRYFESKEALVNELYRRWKGEFARALMHDFPADATVRAQFAEMWRRMVRFAKAHPKAVAFLEMHHHGGYLDETSRVTEQQLMLPVRAFVEQSQRQEALKSGPPELLIALVWGAFIGVVRAGWEDHLALSKENLAAAESCLWEAIRR